MDISSEINKELVEMTNNLNKLKFVFTNNIIDKSRREELRPEISYIRDSLKVVKEMKDDKHKLEKARLLKEQSDDLCKKIEVALDLMGHISK